MIKSDTIKYSGLLFSVVFSVIVLSGCSLSGLKYSHYKLKQQDLQQYPPIGKAKDKIRFVVYGDTRVEKKDLILMEKNNKNIRKIMSNAIKEEEVDFVLHTGDMVKKGTDRKLWEIFKADTQALFEPNKFFPVLGNHEYIKKYILFGDGDPKYFFDLFDNKEFKIFDGVYRHARSYAFEYAKFAYIIVLDSNSRPYPISSSVSAENIHSKWFEERLTDASRYSVLIIALHHPVFSSNDGEGHKVRDKEKLLRKKLVDWKSKNQNTHIMVFSGHNHYYERYEYEGMDFVVTGGGGATFYEPASWYTYESEYGENLISSHSDPHYVLVTIKKGSKPNIKYVLFNHFKKHPLSWFFRLFR